MMTLSEAYAFSNCPETEPRTGGGQGQLLPPTGLLTCNRSPSSWPPPGSVQSFLGSFYLQEPGMLSSRTCLQLLFLLISNISLMTVTLSSVWKHAHVPPILVLLLFLINNIITEIQPLSSNSYYCILFTIWAEVELKPINEDTIYRIKEGRKEGRHAWQ